MKTGRSITAIYVVVSVAQFLIVMVRAWTIRCLPDMVAHKMSPVPTLQKLLSAPIPKTAGITRHRPIRTTNIATAVQQDNDTKGMLIRIPFSQRKSSQVDKARRNRCRKGIKMVTGLFDKNGKPVDIGDRTRLISEDGNIREFEVCFKTLQGTTGEGVDVSLTGVFFCEDGQDYLPRVDKNGVSDMEKWK